MEFTLIATLGAKSTEISINEDGMDKLTDEMIVELVRDMIAQLYTIKK